MKRRTKYLACLLSAAMLAGSVPGAVYGGSFESELPKEEIVLEEELTAEEIGWVEESTEQSEAEKEVEDFTVEETTLEQTPALEEPETVTGTETELATESGTVGPLQWSVNGGVLRITGRGALPEPGRYGHEWRELSYDRVEIGEGVTAIGAQSFEGEYKLKAVSLPESLVRIGGAAFKNCDELTSISIPAKVVEIGAEAFESCNALTSVVISDQVKGLTIGWQAFTWCGIESLTIPGGITLVGEEAFDQCEALRSLTIAEGVKEIGTRAFSGCKSLEKVTVPGSVKKVGKECFQGNKKLQTAVVEEGVTEFGVGVFYNCTSLNDVTLPSTLKVLPMKTFRSCSSLKEIEIPEGVVAIEGEMGNGNFLWCENLQKVTFPSTLKEIGAQAFYGTGLTEAVLPEGLEEIGEEAFADCERLQQVKLPNSLKTMSHGVFSNCVSLSVLQIPEGIRKIGMYFAKDCSNLTEIVIPGSVEEIGHWAFQNCLSLSKIYLEGDVPKFGYQGVFQGVYATVYYPKNNKTYTSEVKQDYGGHLTWVGHQPALRTPSLTGVTNTSTGVKVSWGKVSGASGYSVFRKSGSGSYSYVGRTTNTYYNNNKVTEGTKYTYTVRAYRGSFDTANKHRYDAEYWSGYEKDGVSVVKLRQCLLSAVTNGTSDITVKWNKITGAKGYHVYKKIDSGEYVRIATVGSDTTSYRDKDIKNGGNYVYMVRAYNGDSLSPYRGVRRVRLSRSLISKAVGSGSTGISVTWGKNVRTSGYQVSYETGGVTKTKTVSGRGTTKTTLTGLSRGKTYTIKVRGYRTLSGVKHYSAWSTAKTVKL